VLVDARAPSHEPAEEIVVGPPSLIEPEEQVPGQPWG
jgi:hypothetical protein